MLQMTVLSETKATVLKSCSCASTVFGSCHILEEARQRYTTQEDQTGSRITSCVFFKYINANHNGEFANGIYKPIQAYILCVKFMDINAKQASVALCSINIR